MLGVVSLGLIGCNPSDQDTLETLINQIEIASEVTSNLDLPTEYEIDGKIVTASWHSTASKIITSKGEITVTTQDQAATLILTLSLGDASLQKQFDVVVKGSTDLLLLFAVVSSQMRFDTFSLEEDIDFPTTYVQDGKTITAVWTSSVPESLSHSGEITRGDIDVTVEVAVTLTLNDAVRTEVFTFTVKQHPDSLPINWWHTTPVWKSLVPNETIKPHTPNCFAGAVYRKVVSNRDYWLGIEGTVTLPEVTLDPQRVDSTRPSYFLDNPSIYMGGNARYESDIGLSWMIGYYSDLKAGITTQGIAFRPFWRYITQKEENCTNCYRNANVNDFEYYYFPGDTVKMSVIAPTPGYMQMRIELLELTTHPDYKDARTERYGLSEDFNRVFVTPVFPSEGAGNIATEFKRVNAIDQVANEAKPTINTNSVIANAVWHEVYLYRNIEGDIVRVPFSSVRAAYMTCPLGTNVNGDFSNAFLIDHVGLDPTLGAERITISPNNGTGRLYNTSAINYKNPYRRFYV